MYGFLLLGVSGVFAPARPVIVAQKVDTLRQELELNAADAQGLRAHMREVKAMDERAFAKMDVSPAIARKMTSEALITQTSKAGLYVTYLLYNQPAIGIYRASLSAPSLMELGKRNDLGSAFAAAYLHMQLDPAREPGFNKNGGSMRLFSTDALVAYPPIRRKLAGHEREVILAMSKSLAGAERVNARSKPGKEPFGATGSTVEAAAKLLEQANPKLKVDLMKYPNVDSAMKEISSRAKMLKR